MDLSGIQGILLGDKGFIRLILKEDLARQGIDLFVRQPAPKGDRINVAMSYCQASFFRTRPTEGLFAAFGSRGRRQWTPSRANSSDLKRLGKSNPPRPALIREQEFMAKVGEVDEQLSHHRPVDPPHVQAAVVGWLDTERAVERGMRIT